MILILMRILLLILLPYVISTTTNNHNNDDDDGDNDAYNIYNNYGTVSFHNFKSQNFKLSVSNPKNKYVAYLSVLSQISNCQGLGRKNKHEILKTDRYILSSRTVPIL